MTRLYGNAGFTDPVPEYAMTECFLSLRQLRLPVGYRDSDPALFARFLDLLNRTWADIPEVDRDIVGAHLARSRDALSTLGLRLGVWMLPSAGQSAGYVTYVDNSSAIVIGITFDSFCLQIMDDYRACKLIRHELAHVWQAATGMYDGLLSNDHIEAHADWMARHRLCSSGWRPIEMPWVLPDPPAYRGCCEAQVSVGCDRDFQVDS